MNTNDALSVTQVNKYIKLMMEEDDFLCNVVVRGEISNFKRHTSGHLYFTLKDESSEISAVMFQSAANKLSFSPLSGNTVIVYGRVSVYETVGKYQIYVSTMINDGAGVLFEQYKRLLEKLRAEGLFDADKKKPIPTFPKRIGIVTSPTGAAIRDMINVTGRRYPSAELLISPALVQGADAPADLCRALALLDTLGDCDVIIIGRGGGSIEDLWAFNDEMLVRTVASCNTPIISAVGHETDTTLCDYAADLRAPTPSAAAEQAVPHRDAIMQTIDSRLLSIEHSLEAKIKEQRTAVSAYARHIDSLSPYKKLSVTRERIDAYTKMLDQAVDALLDNTKTRLVGSIGRLEAVNPLAVLKRGYSMAVDESGSVVSSVNNVSSGDRLSLRLSDGTVEVLAQ